MYSKTPLWEFGYAYTDEGLPNSKCFYLLRPSRGLTIVHRHAPPQIIVLYPSYEARRSERWLRSPRPARSRLSRSRASGAIYPDALAASPAKNDPSLRPSCEVPWEPPLSARPSSFFKCCSPPNDRFIRYAYVPKHATIQITSNTTGNLLVVPLPLVFLNDALSPVRFEPFGCSLDVAHGKKHGIVEFESGKYFPLGSSASAENDLISVLLGFTKTVNTYGRGYPFSLHKAGHVAAGSALMVRRRTTVAGMAISTMSANEKNRIRP